MILRVIPFPIPRGGLKMALLLKLAEVVLVTC